MKVYKALRSLDGTCCQMSIGVNDAAQARLQVDLRDGVSTRKRKTRHSKKRKGVNEANDQKRIGKEVKTTVTLVGRVVSEAAPRTMERTGSECDGRRWSMSIELWKQKSKPSVVSGNRNEPDDSNPVVFRQYMHLMLDVLPWFLLTTCGVIAAYAEIL